MKKKVFSVLFFMGILIIFLSFIAPYFSPNDPLATNFAHILEKPSKAYPFGTDQVGRCVMSRIFYGARVSLGMTFTLLSLVFIFGVTIGTISGLSNTLVDTAIMRIVDVILSFPEIVFAIAVVGVIGPGIKHTILALSLIWWTKYARLTRMLVFKEKQAVYVAAGKIAGTSFLKCVFKYIFPNIISPLVIQFVLDIGNIMLALAGLSFLGLGVQPPTPEWGNMLSEGRVYLQTAPWLLIYPGLTIFLTVSLFNILGDMARDILDIKNT